MRSLDFSIADIKHYLEHRNKASFMEQLTKKAAECQKIIRENERICRSLQRITTNIQPQQMMAKAGLPNMPGIPSLLLTTVAL